MQAKWSLHAVIGHRYSRLQTIGRHPWKCENAREIHNGFDIGWALVDPAADCAYKDKASTNKRSGTVKTSIGRAWARHVILNLE